MIRTESLVGAALAVLLIVNRPGTKISIKLRAENNRVDGNTNLANKPENFSSCKEPRFGADFDFEEPDLK